MPGNDIEKISLYEAQLTAWALRDNALVVELTLANCNQPDYRPESDPDFKNVVIVFSAVDLLDTVTRDFYVPDNRDIWIASDRMEKGPDGKLGIEWFCEVIRYRSETQEANTDYVTLRFRAARAEVIAINDFGT